MRMQAWKHNFFFILGEVQQGGLAWAVLPTGSDQNIANSPIEKCHRYLITVTYTKIEKVRQQTKMQIDDLFRNNKWS